MKAGTVKMIGALCDVANALMHHGRENPTKRGSLLVGMEGSCIIKASLAYILEKETFAEDFCGSLVFLTDKQAAEQVSKGRCLARIYSPRLDGENIFESRRLFRVTWGGNMDPLPDEPGHIPVKTVTKLFADGGVEIDSFETYE